MWGLNSYRSSVTSESKSLKKSYFLKHSNVKIKLKKCVKKTHIAIGCKRGGLIWGLNMVIALRDKNILGHRQVDGWTRWVGFAYNGAAKNNKPKTTKHKGQAVDGFRNFDDAKANGERDWH